MQNVNLHSKIKELQQRASAINYSQLEAESKIELSEEDRTIRGYLAVWGVKDSYGTIFVKGCCAKSLQERGPGSNAKYKITALWQHDQRDPIGKFMVLREDDYGLYGEILCDEGVPSAERACIQVKSGTINQFSIGFNYLYDKMEYDETRDAILLKEIVLMEGSVVTIGSNEETYAFRSKDELLIKKDYLRQETEQFIRSLPANKQLEARSLFRENISLAKAEPLEVSALRNDEPIEEQSIINLLSNTKIFG